jgi:hypothetical protein
MSPKRGDRAAPPALEGEYEIRFLTTETAKGWEELCQQVPTNLVDAWWRMRREPLPVERTPRHHPLHGLKGTGFVGGRTCPRWQIEVTGSGRIWYLVDEERRTVWIDYASPRHPKSTE